MSAPPPPPPPRSSAQPKSKKSSSNQPSSSSSHTRPPRSTGVYNDIPVTLQPVPQFPPQQANTGIGSQYVPQVPGPNQALPGPSSQGLPQGVPGPASQSYTIDPRYITISGQVQQGYQAFVPPPTHHRAPVQHPPQPQGQQTNVYSSGQPAFPQMGSGLFPVAPIGGASQPTSQQNALMPMQGPLPGGSSQRALPPPTCPVCHASGPWYPDRNAMMLHFTRRHDSEYPTAWFYNCPYCENFFLSRDDWNEHYAAEHNEFRSAQEMLQGYVQGNSPGPGTAGYQAFENTTQPQPNTAVEIPSDYYCTLCNEHCRDHWKYVRHLGTRTHKRKEKNAAAASASASASGSKSRPQRKAKK